MSDRKAARASGSPAEPIDLKSSVAPSKRLCRPIAIQDSVYPNMWRVQWPDGRLSDITNLSRAKDAIAAFMESEERRQRER